MTRQIVGMIGGIVAMAAMLHGCGGGGGGDAAPKTSAAVTLATVAKQPNQTISGIDVTVLLPPGVSVFTNTTSNAAGTRYGVKSGVLTAKGNYALSYASYSAAKPAASGNGALFLTVISTPDSSPGEFVQFVSNFLAGTDYSAKFFTTKDWVISSGGLISDTPSRGTNIFGNFSSQAKYTIL